jgi:hypothetical protein
LEGELPSSIIVPAVGGWQRPPSKVILLGGGLRLSRSLLALCQFVHDDGQYAIYILCQELREESERKEENGGLNKQVFEF